MAEREGATNSALTSFWWGPWNPGRQEEPRSNGVEHSGERGGRRRGWMEPVPSRRSWGRGGVPRPWEAHLPQRDQRGRGETFGGQKIRGTHLEPTQPWGACWGQGPDPLYSGARGIPEPLQARLRLGNLHPTPIQGLYLQHGPWA